jgi:FkbM family methyltransferase
MINDNNNNNTPPPPPPLYQRCKLLKIVKIIQFIIRHPLNQKNKRKALLRFMNWQLSHIFNPYPIIYPYTSKCRLIIKKGMAGATGNLYCGLHEYQDMFLLLHLLRPKDLFVDIGANIGSYSMLSAAHIGCDTIAIEPVPATFNHLLDNIRINEVKEKVEALNIALGSQEGTTAFTTNFGTMNHVATSNDRDTILVTVSSLDKILGGRIPILLKIDVEGFESEVLNGASQTLADDNLKAIIIELNGSGTRYNYNESAIQNKLYALGFKPYSYNPIKRELLKQNDLNISDNFLYLRDIDFITGRIQQADKISILGNMI